MRDLRLHYDHIKGWILDTPIALLPVHIENVVRKCLPLEIDKVLCTPHGERREQMTHAIELLRYGKVTQNIVGIAGNGKGDIEIFNSERFLKKQKIG